MLKVLERKEWVVEVEQTRHLLLNEEEDVINALCQGGRLKPVYFLFQKKNKTVVSYIALRRGNEIKHPFHFFYSAWWVDPALSDTQYCEYTTELLNSLLSKFTKVVIKLPIGVFDVRPFLWTQFSVTNYYTYIKPLATLNYHPATEKNIRKAKNGGYNCKQEELENESLLLNLELFKDLKVYSSAQIITLKNLMLVMKEHGRITSFNCYKDDKLVAANLVFLDEKNKTAYTVLLNKVPRTNKDDVHSLLHDFFFTKLQTLGYTHVDLLGGDMQGIAPFKSRFKTILTPHFLVSYSKNSAVLYGMLKKIKLLVKKVIATLN